MSDRLTSWVITVDGPSGSGKSSVSKLLARTLDFMYLDTGAMYRAFALMVYEDRKQGGNRDLEAMLAAFCIRFVSEEDGHVFAFLGDRDVSNEIRLPEVTMLASELSKRREVRHSMSQRQREFARDANLVAEGRDMGTVVFPDAQVKFYLTADPVVRARRRYLELKASCREILEEEVLRDIERRDKQDSERKEAPLRPAPGAEIIDSSRRSLEEVLAMMLGVVRVKMSGVEI
ncbi:MAG: (d)CMP kinase [Deltaproteobacteria bacterium]|nr:(d)CMP kinase [Deltaproteobacteria bacterium]